MSAPPLPSPLRRLAWNGNEWVSPDQAVAGIAEDDLLPQWLAWAGTQHLQPRQAEAAQAAVRLLRTGASSQAATAAGMIAGLRGNWEHVRQLTAEETWIQSVIDDLKRMDAPAELVERYQKRLAAVSAAISAYSNPAAAVDAQQLFRARLAQALRQPAGGPEAPTAGEGAKTPPPPARPISLRDLFAENSVLVLAALGAFLLVVATVLFELYGTTGFGGGVRLGAVVVLNIIFAAAGYFARRRKGLETVGQIYIALAAVLLPLVGVAAWTFLDLGARGIAVYQAVAITAAACTAVYGVLAMRLDLRPYGEITGVAILVTVVSVSRWAGGEYWLAAGIAVGPLVYAVWERALRVRVFNHFQWFAHATAVVALGAAAPHEPSGWLWTATLGALAFSYLSWQAISPDRYRAWIGEAATIFAATAASVAIGVGAGHFVLPIIVAIPLLALGREPELFGVVGRLYRPHVAHLHVAVVLAIALAVWEYSLGGSRSLAAGLVIATGLYAVDYYLGSTDITGYALRATFLLALVAVGRAIGLGPWTATLAAVALIAYAATFARPSLAPLRPLASIFFYTGLVVVLANLADAQIGAGRWEIVGALVVSAVGFGAAAELGAVRFSPIAARGLFSLAWFAGVDALDAGGWRGPFDALLALFYVALGQARQLARRSVATASRRWFVHAAAFVALVLCFTGSQDEVWWRLAAAFAALTVAYWWLALVRDEVELPWLAWSALAAGALSIAIAIVPDAWRGPAIAGEALVITAAWYGARPMLGRKRLETGAIVLLGILAATGLTLSLRENVPTWPQSAASMLVAAFLFGWSLVGAEEPIPAWRPYERSAASFFAATGVLLGGAVLQLDAGVIGLVVVAVAALHGEWALRARNQVEHWYALGAMLATALVIYFWPYADRPAALAAVEFVALAAITARAAIGTRRWYLAYPAVLLLAPALHIAFTAVGVHDHVPEEIAFAALAWVAGFVGLAIRTRYSNRWAWSVEAAAATIAAGALIAMSSYDDADPAGIELLAYAPLIYTSAMQDRQRWVLAFTPATALFGAVVLLASRNADTILYAAALGVIGLVMWLLGRAVFERLGRHPVVDMHRYLGAGMLVASAASGFFFPQNTGRLSLGAGLATFALLITAAVMWLDGETYGFRPGRYAAIVAACSALYFVARFVSLDSWELVGPGLGFIASGIILRSDAGLPSDVWVRRLLVAGGLALAMGWAGTLTVEGDVWWLIVLLIEGAVAVAAGVSLRSQTLLAGGGIAIALASLRAMLLIAQAGYLFVAFAVVALVLLSVATALALGRERYLSSSSRLREQLSHWD